MRRKSHTCGNDIIYNENLLAGLDGAFLQLEVVGTVLLHELSGNTRARQLAPLPDRHEAGVELQGQRWAKQEAAGVKANNDIGLDGIAIGAKVQELKLEGVDQGCMGLGVEKPWHNIQEVDTGDGEVGEAAQGALKAYLCTGEFGGGGGGGGGLSSRGMIGRGCSRGRWVGGRHFWAGGQVALRLGS